MARGQESARAIRHLLLLVFMFFAFLFSISVAWAYLDGLIVSEAGGPVLFTGFVTLFVGLAMSYSWLGEKPDPSRTSYVVKVQGWGPMVFPRKDPRRKLSEHTEQSMKSARIIVDLIGLAVILTGVLLMSASIVLIFLV